MITLEQFVAAFSEELTETDPKTISANTKFRDLSEWSSIFAIDVFAIMSQYNNVEVNLYDLTDCETIEDIYNTILSLHNMPQKEKHDILSNTYWEE